MDISGDIESHFLTKQAQRLCEHAHFCLQAEGQLVHHMAGHTHLVRGVAFVHGGHGCVARPTAHGPHTKRVLRVSRRVCTHV